MQFNQIISENNFRVWQGLALEKLCLEEHRLISKTLGFSGVQYQVGSWYKKNDQESGFQIDLLFKRADGVLTLIEVKYAKNIPLAITKEVDKKVERLREEVKAKYIHKVLVTVYKPSKELLDSNYFDEILLFEDLI